MAKRALLFVISVIFLASCAPKGDVTINVFAAASLTEALREIGQNYEKAHNGVKISFNFDSSGKLQTQIENGAEADIFFSAAQKQMNDLENGGFIDASTRRDLLQNKVVLIVPEGKPMLTFEDLATDKVSLIALGNSDVPVGQYSEEIFRYLGVWDAVSAKASLGSNVKEVLSQVETGSVDCGVVYSTDAAAAKGVTVAAQAPDGSHSPVVYPIALLKNAKNKTAATAFLEYLSAPESVKVFEKIGFVSAT